MTVEPAFTRANLINSDSLDWSYIGISVTVGYSTSARPASRRSTAHSPSTRNGGRRRPALSLLAPKPGLRPSGRPPQNQGEDCAETRKLDRRDQCCK